MRRTSSGPAAPSPRPSAATSTSLSTAFSPLVSCGWAKDQVEADWPAWSASRSAEWHRGWELTLAGVVDLRRGRVKDRSGDVDGETSGFGVALPLGPFARVRYDRAEVPQAKALRRDVKREGYAIELSPLEILRRF